eukprot:1183247-Prorocentrum_minimum.AAC.1
MSSGKSSSALLHVDDDMPLAIEITVVQQDAHLGTEPEFRRLASHVASPCHPHVPYGPQIALPPPTLTPRPPPPPPPSRPSGGPPRSRRAPAPAPW